MGKDVPWEIAVGFFRGECTWSSEHGTFGRLTEALPYGGYPTCDLTGASIRRLQAASNATSNATNVSATPAPTPPPTQPPTAAATTQSNATSNATNGTNATGTTAAPGT